MSEHDGLSVEEERKKAHEVLDTILDGDETQQGVFVNGKLIHMQDLGGEE